MKIKTTFKPASFTEREGLRNKHKTDKNTTEEKGSEVRDIMSILECFV